MNITMNTRGFSLIEVLISVVVLSLGVLGLGALIPVVVSAQRDANDLVLSEAASSAAEGALIARTRPVVRQPNGERISAFALWDVMGPVSGPDDKWLPDGASNQLVTSPDEDFRGNWIVPLYDEDTGTVSLIGDPTSPYEPATGGWNRPEVPAATLFTPNVRLFPSPRDGGGAPRYVWDFVLRRVGRPNEPGGSLQAAIFVQSIDRGIRLPRDPGDPADNGRRLSRGELLQRELALLGTPDEPDRPFDLGRTLVPNDSGRDTPLSFPVAVDEDGRPTGTGRGPDGQRDSALHGAPIALRIDYNGSFDVGTNNPDFDETDGVRWNDRDRLMIRFEQNGSLVRQGFLNGPYESTDTFDELARLLAQPGQRFVDSSGLIYEIRGIDQRATAEAPGNDPVVIIDPPILGSISDPLQLGRIAFVPTPPISVRVVNIPAP